MYCDDYNIITTDIGDIGGNGVFIDYNGKKGLLTAAHVGRPLYRGFKDKTPGNIVNGRLDSAFIYLDDNFYTHVHNTDNFAKTSPIRIENTKNSKSINGKIVTTIGYDKGGNFHELYDSLKSESGVAIEITPEYDDYITDTLVSRTEGLRRKKLYESRRGTYVGRYLYRITGDQNRQGGGLSGSPIFSKGELVGILTGGVFLDGKHFSVFSPLSKIYDDMLSDLDE